MNYKKLKSYQRFFRFLLKHDIKGVRLLADKLPKMFLKLPQAQTRVQILGGTKLNINPQEDKTIDPFLYYYGVYEWGTLNVIEKTLKPNSFFVDVGANIGIISLFASKLLNKNGKVFAFEPMPPTLELMKENIINNSISNIEVFPFACSNIGETKFIVQNDENNRGGASLCNNKSKRSTQVKSIILDDFLEEVPDLIKIDVEGHELEVLKGLERTINNENPPILIIESSSKTITKNSSPALILQFIKNSSSNYRVYKLKGEKVRPSKLIEVKSINMLPNDDNLFCFPEKKNPKIYQL